MKVKDLQKKINSDDVDIAVTINNKKEFSKEVLEADVKEINIETNNNEDLESLGYSFEVGV